MTTFKKSRVSKERLLLAGEGNFEGAAPEFEVATQIFLMEQPRSGSTKAEVADN